MARRKVKHIMERVGITATGQAIAYIKEALREVNMSHETHITSVTRKITKDKRVYDIPRDAIKVTDIQVKNHMNSDGEYRSIPRLIYEPHIKDED